MSIFASRTTRTIELPFDAPNTVTIQKLPGRHLEKAREEDQVASLELVQRMGAANFRKNLDAATGADKTDTQDAAEKAKAAAVAAVRADPLNLYHHPTVLKHGIKAWTYDVPVTPEAIDDLDDEASEFLTREILRLTKPALFDSPAVVEEAQKNG